MKLLLLTPQLPYPPHQGTSIRNFNILRWLSVRHQVDLLTFGRPDNIASSPLPSLCRRIVAVPPPSRSMADRLFDLALTSHADMAHRLDSRELDKSLRQMVRETQYDVIQIEGIEMAQAWLSLNPVTHTVFDDHNAEYVLQKSAFESDLRHLSRLHAAAYSFIQYRRLTRFERTVCLRTKHIAAVSHKDSAALTSLDSSISPVVIPNGVDVEYYDSFDSGQKHEEAECNLVFTGKMDFRPNVDAALWFANEILPSLRSDFPAASISFVGQSPSARVRALSRNPGVVVTGPVPDVRPYIAAAGIFVVALRMGGGTRLKVLEAMAMGKAIVSTALGVEGIDCTPGREILIADNPRDFAQAVATLIRDPAARTRLGTNARRLVLQKYDWKQVLPNFEKLYPHL